MKQFILYVIITLIPLFASGCFSDSGFDKRATIMPDRVGISVGQQRYKTEDAAWRGITFNLQWDLK